MITVNTQAAQSGSITSPPTFKVAIIGGGICGACIGSTLSQLSRSLMQNGSNAMPLLIDVFDQGRSGVGGRASHRSVRKFDSREGKEVQLGWDHGCQFFRADTSRMASAVQEWIDKGYCSEWKGKFVNIDNRINRDFFGMAHGLSPFYVGNGGMNSIAKNLLNEATDSDSKMNSLKIYEGTRVTDLKRRDASGKWTLVGVDGERAYHDSVVPKSLKSSSTRRGLIDDSSPLVGGRQYDVVVLTDVSSTTFTSWHRASAGVPEDFSLKVKERVKSRVPLFTCMLAFDSPLPTDISAISFGQETESPLWFASRNNHKPGLDTTLDKDCWTLVSTPEYAIRKIEETPMRDTDGKFVPQSKSYLESIPGAELEKSFRKALVDICRIDECNQPKTFYMTAQRWGSAMPAERNASVHEPSSSKKLIAGTVYDSKKQKLSPTALEVSERSFIEDEMLSLIQAGDMVSSYTPGFEAAALSGFDVAAHIISLYKHNT